MSKNKKYDNNKRIAIVKGLSRTVRNARNEEDLQDF
jgi:hypothetical protein